MKRVVAALLLAFLCGAAVLYWFLDQLPGEGDTVNAVSVSFENRTDEFHYVVIGAADTAAETAIETHTLIRLQPNEEHTVGAGPDPRTSQSRCFDNEQFWVIKSKSGIPYWRTWEEHPERTVDDLVIVDHLGPDTCVPEGELTVRVDN